MRVSDLAVPVLGAMLMFSSTALANPCNPCGGEAANPCNPCGGKAMANPCNPCGGKAMANPCNPCGGAAMAPVNPCMFLEPPKTKLAKGKKKDLVSDGSDLWADTSLSPVGVACSTCHVQAPAGPYALMNPTFAEDYPHKVKMAKDRAGVERPITAAEMVQFCMLVPMSAQPLPWDSKELAALTAYVESVQDGYTPTPGAMANPCNPCGGQPMANPCNPCGGKPMANPCNPCGGK